MAEQQEEQQRLPEVAEYLKTRKEALDRWEAYGDAVRDEYADAFADGVGEDDYFSDKKRSRRAEYNGKRDASYDALRIAINEAWNKLGQTTTDPLVRFIVAECKEYQNRAVQVLEILPATVEQLDELAEGQDWCLIWNQFRDKAIDAGVMPGVKPLSAAYKAVLDQVDEESCCSLGASARSRIVALLDALVEEFTAEKVPA